MDKICAVCASYNRPRLLGNAVAMFLAQDYPDKELLILEDSGVFGDTEITGPSWRMVSSSHRRTTIAKKRNELIGLTDARYIAVMDDDDWYLPWHLSAAVAALKDRVWAQPRQAMEWNPDGTLSRYHVFSQQAIYRFADNNPTDRRDAMSCCYGGQWSYQRNAFLLSRGYPEGYMRGEDTAWCGVMFARFGPSADTITEAHPPSYIYSRDQSGSWHTSEMGNKAIRNLEQAPRSPASEFIIELPAGYSDVQVPGEVKPRTW